MTGPRSLKPMLLLPKGARREVAEVPTKLRAVEHPTVLQMLISRHALSSASRLESAVPVVWLVIDTKMKQGKKLVPICAIQHHMPLSPRQSQKPNRARGRVPSLEKCAAVI